MDATGATKTRRDLACSALWSDTHPLAILMAIANGTWVDGRWQPATSWSVKQLIAFTETLPETIIERIRG